MLKDIAEKIYKSENLNCAETIIKAANEYYDLGLHEHDMKMMAGYGGGLCIGHTCGAILAAVSVLSMKYVETKAHESSDISPVTNLLTKKFKKKYGSLLCKDIKAQIYDKEVKCLNTIKNACDILEETILEYDN